MNLDFAFGRYTFIPFMSLKKYPNAGQACVPNMQNDLPSDLLNVTLLRLWT